jgi:hypothetical protein
MTNTPINTKATRKKTNYSYLYVNTITIDDHQRTPPLQDFKNNQPEEQKTNFHFNHRVNIQSALVIKV